MQVFGLFFIIGGAFLLFWGLHYFGLFVPMNKGGAAG